MTIRTNQLKCQCCNQLFHQSCSGITSRAVREQYILGKAQWTCPECELIQNQTPPTVPTFVEETPESGKVEGTIRSSLRIMQFNADFISTKWLELQDRLIADDIDICLVQETKLTKGSQLKSMKGYEMRRADRGLQNAGGGLLCLIREGIVFDELDKVALEGTETHSIKVRLGKSEWIYLTNVYTPPPHTTGQDVIKLRTDLIPTFSSSLICGDLNAHHSLWDEIQPEDDRGNQVLDWVLDKELTILNDGSPTRVNRATGNESTPDLTLCGSKWADKITWHTLEGIGSSDHSPICITISAEVQHQSVFGSQARWRSNGVDWGKFIDEVEALLQAKLSEQGTLPGKTSA